MAKVQKNISLLAYNTFGIDIKTKYFYNYNQANNIKELTDQKILTPDIPFIVLGGGSNQLFTSNYEGLIIHPTNTSINVIKENDEHVWLKADAGLDWDEFVAYAVEKGFGGIENLSNIPGNVGASPVQNIGAYGVEAKDCIEAVNIVSLSNGQEQTLSNTECDFGYRHSIFKTKLKNQVLVDSVIFKLAKNPEFVLHYGSVKDEIQKQGEISLKTIRSTIVNIRESKLPNHKEIGNGGSFFKNPVLPSHEAEALKSKYDDMPMYDADESYKKLAAGWLIEQCGLKGYINKKGTAGIHDKQALVLVNKGGASGQDIVDVAKLVQHEVYEKFGIRLEPEVIIHS